MVVDPYSNFFSALNSLSYKSNKGKLFHYFFLFSFLFLFWFLVAHPVYLVIDFSSKCPYSLQVKFCDIFDNRMFFRRHSIAFISWCRSLYSSSNMSVNAIINWLSYASKTQKHSFFSIYTFIVFKNSLKALIFKAPNFDFFEPLEFSVGKLDLIFLILNS